MRLEHKRANQEGEVHLLPLHRHRDKKHVAYVPERIVTTSSSRNTCIGIGMDPAQVEEAHRLLLANQEADNKANRVERERLEKQIADLEHWQEQAYVDRVNGTISEPQWKSLNDRWLKKSERCER